MEKAELKSFGKPDRAGEFPRGRMDAVIVGGAEVRRMTFLPGWKWSTSVGPSVNRKSCPARHFFYHVSGVLRVRMDDGDEFECRPGDVYILPPGHDAWVVGDEPVVAVDFQPTIDHAKAG